VGLRHRPRRAVRRFDGVLVAAIALPVIDGLKLDGPPVLSVKAQIAIADAASIVLLPLVINPSKAAAQRSVHWRSPHSPLCCSSSCGTSSEMGRNKRCMSVLETP
jgi:hypothetical protein